MASLNVMIVEDEPLIAMAMEALVQDEGGTVLGPFSTMDTALKAARFAAGIDCAMLDYNLGKDSSAPVADALEARNIPFVFISGQGVKDIDKRFTNRPVLQKPVDDAALKRFLRQHARP
jgi:CheY-like chemotaxis protein